MLHRCLQHVMFGWIGPVNGTTRGDMMSSPLQRQRTLYCTDDRTWHFILPAASMFDRALLISNSCRSLSTSCCSSWAFFLQPSSWLFSTRAKAWACSPALRPEGLLFITATARATLALVKNHCERLAPETEEADYSAANATKTRQQNLKTQQHVVLVKLDVLQKPPTVTWVLWCFTRNKLVRRSVTEPCTHWADRTSPEVWLRDAPHTWGLITHLCDWQPAGQHCARMTHSLTRWSCTYTTGTKTDRVTENR